MYVYVRMYIGKEKNFKNLHQRLSLNSGGMNNLIFFSLGSSIFSKLF